MLGFTLTAPFIDAFAKLAGKEVPIFEISASRFLFQFVLLIPIAIYLKIKIFYTPNKSHLFFYYLRALLILSATSFFILAVKFLPLAEAISIFFVSPFILTILGSVFLKEKIGIRRIFACIVGFTGALLIIQPQYASFGFASIYPIITAFCFSFYLLLTRTMSQNTDPILLQIYTSLAALSIILPILILMNGTKNIYFDPIIPETKFIFYLFGVGLASTISHLFLTYAFKFAEVSVLAPLQYFEIIIATFLGFIIFKDLPNAISIFGILLIISSGIYVFLREQKLKKSSIISKE